MVHEARLKAGAQSILQRPITDAEVAAFEAIYQGAPGASVDQKLNSSFNTIADSGAASNVRDVISYYQVFFGRQPDAGGLAAWTARLDSGDLTLDQLADKFAQAPEFLNQVAGQSNSQIVTAQYANVLGRQPDGPSLATFIQRLDNNEIDLADLGRLFALSPEAKNRLDTGTDAFLINAGNGNQDFSTGQTIFTETVRTATAPTTPVTPTPPATGAQNQIDLFGTTGRVDGTAGRDTFSAESDDLSSRTNIDGGAGNDTLAVFNEGQGVAISPRANSVETVVWTEQTNDRQSIADNNVGGYNSIGLGSDGTVGVDVELDAGRMSGVTRWEDYDSRADLVIEDARGTDNANGTFTADKTVAMVSTDSGNVDYAVYFDNPVSQPNAPVSTVFLRALDLDNATTVDPAVNSGTLSGANGVLQDGAVLSFVINFNGAPVTVDLNPNADARVFGPTASYDTLAQAVNDALLANPAFNGDLRASVGNSFRELVSVNNDLPAGTSIYGREIVITSISNAPITAVSAAQFSNDPSAAIAARVTSDVVARADDLIAVKVELDDVGKGSTGGDLVAGAMSTGRQDGDDGTSDSGGIQRFDIEVDRTSNLQTINSTNNALEVVNIVNGRNDGPNNTSTAFDDEMGDLTVRGRANPNNDVATDNPMPGAVPQHDDFGFSDVRAINASKNMIGSVDLTVDLSDRIVAKYLDNSDTGTTGDADDVNFRYDLSNGANGNDEFFVNMSSTALVNAGTASREDFSLRVNGNGGNDSIVTNVGLANKFLDEQGQDAYQMTSLGGFYANQANNNAAAITVTGGAGNDTIWTHGWGDALIGGGRGSDTVYTDNEGTIDIVQLQALAPISNTFQAFASRLSSVEDEHQQIDYQVGAVWTFNDATGADDENGVNGAGNGNVANISGPTNDGVVLAAGTRVATTNYVTALKVSFFGSGGSTNAANSAYTSSIVVPTSLVAADGRITDQSMTQLVKRAINDDPVLNKVLEAVDGPGQSLAVYSKIDGAFVSTDLEIDLYETITPNGAAAVVQGTPLTGTGYDTSGAASSVFSDFQNFGRDSVAESDNTISIAADNAADVTVLSTNDFTDADANGIEDNANVTDNVEGTRNGASNENLIIAQGQFGTETIFNFDASDGSINDNADDRFDFRAIDFVANNGSTTFSNGSINQADDSISIIAEVADGSNNTKAAIEALYNAAGNTTALEHIVIVYDEASNDFDSTDNTGSVYYVSNPAGTGATVATFQGDINLIGTDWASLDQDNFL